MFYLLKANCRYNQLISNGDLYHRVTTQNEENLPAIIVGKANHPTTMIAAFNIHRCFKKTGFEVNENGSRPGQIEPISHFIPEAR